MKTQIAPGINYPSLTFDGDSYDIAATDSALLIRNGKHGWTDSEFTHARFVPSFSDARFVYYTVPSNCTVRIEHLSSDTLRLTLLDENGDAIATTEDSAIFVIKHSSVDVKALIEFYEVRDGSRVFTPSGLF